MEYSLPKIPSFTDPFDSRATTEELDALSWEKSAGKSISEKDRTRNLIIPANKNTFNITKGMIHLLDQVSSHKLIYAIDFPEVKALGLFAALLLKPEQYSSIQSAFIIPGIKNVVFFECENSSFSTIFGNFNFRKMDTKEVLLTFFANAHFGSLLKKPYNICRFIQEPYRNDPVEVLDIDYKHKRAIIRLWPKATPPLNSNERTKKAPIDNSVLVDSKKACSQKRIYLNFEKTKYNDNGFVFRDQKFVDSFLILKVDISQLVVFGEANITFEERERFKEPLATSTKNYNVRVKAADLLIRDIGQVPVPSLKPIPIKPVKSVEVSAVLHVPSMKVRLGANTIAKDPRKGVLALYQLVRLSTGEYGVITNIDTKEVTILLTTNQKVTLPIDVELIGARSDHLARDRRNRRMFIGDVVNIKEGKFAGSDATIIESIKKSLFVRAPTKNGNSELTFVDACDTEQIMDDEGPVLNM